MISLGRVDPVPVIDFRLLPEFIRVRVADGWEFGYCREHSKLMLDVRDPLVPSLYARISVLEAIKRGLVPRFELVGLNHHSREIVRLWEPEERFCRICQIDEVIGTFGLPDPDWRPLCGCPCW